MKINAYHCEWEAEPPEDTDWHNGCATYPIVVTNEHPASSFRQFVILIDGEPRGPGDMPPGELQLPAAAEGLAGRLAQLGYTVCSAPVDDGWLEAWHRAPTMQEHHWHPEARWVSF